MKNTVVIYSSKYGYTAQYAGWIAEELSCRLAERSDFSAADFSRYDIIIYGGGLYAGGVSGISLITKNFDKIKDKDIILFTCGLADPLKPQNTEHIKKSLENVLTPQMREKIKLFHLRGGIDYSRLGVVHKAMMGMMRRVILHKGRESMSEEDKQLVDTYGERVDFTDRESIKPLTDFAKELMAESVL